jgi:hypothetical protein
LNIYSKRIYIQFLTWCHRPLIRKNLIYNILLFNQIKPDVCGCLV